MMITFVALLTLQHLYCVSANKEECLKNYFKLPGMERCHLHLSCVNLGHVSIIKPLGRGAVKDVFLSTWKGFFVALSIPVSDKMLPDFISGVNVLKLLNPNKHVVQFVGYCEQNNVLLTEYHPSGNAVDFFNAKPPGVNGIELCHQYSLILNHLHTGPAGRRVFCDSNSLEKLLSQLLVTSDSTLVLNDVDALPEVVNSLGVKCGHKQLLGNFVAPEQLWHSSALFSDSLMPGYDEKTDIWKAADVCEFFLRNGGDILRYKLFDLHKRCKNRDPVLRPTSQELEQMYRDVLNDVKNHVEL